MRPRAYVAGPLSAKTIAKRNENIAAAELVGKALLGMGYAVVVPHLMGHWQGEVSEAAAMESDLSLLETCHIVVLVGDWRNSKGACVEVDFARENGIPVYSEWKQAPPAEDIVKDITSRIIDRYYDRRRQGIREYGRATTPGMEHNRRWLLDFQEEMMDGVVYAELELESSRSEIPNS